MCLAYAVRPSTQEVDTWFRPVDHLRVTVTQPEGMFAMKCLAMRIGAEFHDEEDVRSLLHHLISAHWSGRPQSSRSIVRSSTLRKRRSMRSRRSCLRKG